MKKHEIVLKEILESIYWRTFTPLQTMTIISIIEDKDVRVNKANDICEILEIEKRENRKNINLVLRKHNIIQ
jgi:hypothetical protein